MPGKISAAHHSVEDWDFEQDAPIRFLDNSYYISEPTSLSYFYTGAQKWCSTLCRIPETLLLPQGEVRTYVRYETVPSFGFSIRNQSPLGTASSWNQYLINLFTDELRFYRIVNNVWNRLDTHVFTIAADTWHHMRVFWYNGKTPGELPAICVDIYLEIDGEWVKQGATFYDTVNKWKDSEINRAGPHFVTRYNAHIWFDDTEIWGPV